MIMITPIMMTIMIIIIARNIERAHTSVKATWSHKKKKKYSHLKNQITSFSSTLVTSVKTMVIIAFD